jgi:tripartite-type tricarboxylate transporter receptor subunit TctC
MARRDSELEGGQHMVRQIVAAALGAALVHGAFAQANYPMRPITMVVGFAPGGGTDTVARIVAQKVSGSVGQSVVVENKPGAGGSVATDHVAKSAPDGYTILLGSVGSLAVAPHLIAKLPYDPLRDLAPITMAVVFANVLVVQPSVPAKTLAEFVKLAKDKPGTITYGSSGIGGAGHLAGELLKIMAQIDIVHVPYKGGGPAMRGMLGGEIQAIFATPVSSNAQIKAGKVRAIATTGATRSAYLPDVPTVAESGYPGYEATNWYAYMAPAGTPKEIVERLHRELVQALNAPDVRAQLEKQGVEAKPGTPEELAKYMAREHATWGRVVKEAKIQAN